MSRRDELITSIFEAMNATKRSMHGRLHALIGDSPISRSQLELLFVLKQLQPVTSKKLADHMQLTPGAVSQLVEGLADEAFVSRETDPSDRRLQILRLSKSGMQELQRIEKNRHELFKHVLDDLTDDELALLLRINQKIATHLSAIAKK